MVHGTSGSWLEHSPRRSRGRCIANCRCQLGAWLQDLPQRRGRRVRTGLGSVGAASDRRPVPVPGRADRDRRSPPGRHEHPRDRDPVGPITIDGLTGTTPECVKSKGFRPFEAHRRATARRARRHRRRLESHAEMRHLVAELRAQRWSWQQISRHLRKQFPDDPWMWLCHGTIYQALYQPTYQALFQPTSALLRPSRLAPHRRSSLRTGRDHRRAHQKAERRHPRFERPMLTIHDRPFRPEDRS